MTERQFQLSDDSAEAYRLEAALGDPDGVVGGAAVGNDFLSEGGDAAGFRDGQYGFVRALPGGDAFRGVGRFKNQVQIRLAVHTQHERLRLD